MTWLDLATALAVAGALLVLPGLPAAVATGLRGAWLLGAAVPLSATVVTVAAVVAPRVGLDWSLIPIAVVAVGLGLVAGVVRLALRRWWDLGPLRVGAEWVTIAAAVLGGGVLTARLTSVLGSSASISQTYDAIFHLNAVRWVIETGDASPANVAGLTSDTAGFYPAGFHALAALTTEISGVDLPTGVNGTWLALSVVAWPLGIVLLTRALVGSSTAVLIAAGAAAAALPAFPYLLVEYGVLYPLLAGYAVLPAALAVAVRALGVGSESVPGKGINLPWTLLAVATLPGIVLMHPTSLASWLAFVTPWVLILAVRRVRRSSGRWRWAWGVAAVMWVISVVAVLQVLRPAKDARLWSPLGTMAQSMGEFLFLAVNNGSIALVATALVWIGVTSVVRRPSLGIDARLAVLAAPAVVFVLYVVVGGVGNETVRDIVTGSWYNNPPRVAALLPIAAVPLLALGAARSWQLASRSRPATRLSERGPRAGLALGIGAALVLTLGLQGRAVDKGLDDVRGSYALREDSGLLSTDEEVLLSRLDDEVPAEAVVAGSPWTGTSLAYALSDRSVLLPHILVDRSPDTVLLTEALRDAEVGNAVCAAAGRLGVGYLLDFGRREVQDIGPHVYPGFQYPATSGAFELVDREGGAKLYRLTACG